MKNIMPTITFLLGQIKMLISNLIKKKQNETMF